MFERIIELVAQGWDRIRPYVILHAYEQGVVLRFGTFNRTVGPGIHWKWPWAEEVVELNACVTTLRLPPQTLTTSDDSQVVIAAIVKYQIRDPKPYVCDIWDQVDVLADVCMGAIRKATQTATYRSLIESPPELQILSEIRKQVNRYGFKIESITFTDLARVKSIRLIGEHQQNIAN